MGRAGKVLAALRALFYIAVIVGVALFVADLYSSRAGWSVALAEPPRVSPEGASLRIQAYLDIYNPSHSTVRAKLVWYMVYLGDEPVGQGLIPYLDLKPGHNRVPVFVTVDLLHLPCAVVGSLAKERSVAVSVRGYATVTLMLFGRIGYRDVTVPFNTTVYRVEVPLDPVSEKALSFAGLLCQAARGAATLPFRLP
jgi:hypothetical protein